MLPRKLYSLRFCFNVVSDTEIVLLPGQKKNLVRTYLLSSRYTGDYFQNLKLKVFQTVDSMVLTAVGLRQGGC
jgi:hypothetical protein